MFKKAILAVVTVTLSVGTFIAAGVADAKVNNDWNRLHYPETEVTIQTVYIIDGDVYVVDEATEMHNITWIGDLPVLDD